MSNRVEAKRENFDAPDLPLQKALDEYVSCYEILRVAGFTPDELFIMVCKLDDDPLVNGIQAVIRRGATPLHVGNGEFHINLAVVHGKTQQEIAEAYQAEILRHQKFTPRESRAWVQNVRECSLIRGRAIELFFALQMKGFAIKSPEDFS